MEDVRLTAVSGLGGKQPASFLLESRGARILIDLGEGPDDGAVVDVSGVGTVDAVVLGHDHGDHAGGLDRLPQVGNPPVYAAAPLLPRLPGGVKGRPLRLGANEVCGLPLLAGRTGHAPGGIWLRFDVGGGVLYMGDHCRESPLFACDMPPLSRLVILDASYGADDTSQEDCIAGLKEAFATPPLLLPLPPYGRAGEVALHLARCGCMPRLCDETRAALRWMATRTPAWFKAGAAAEILRIADAAPPIGDEPEGLMLAADAQCKGGASARLAGRWRHAPSPVILFTGHIAKGTPAESLTASGRAAYRRWNVHARASENADLVRMTGAEFVMPCFCELPEIARLAPLLSPARTVTQASFSWS